MNTSFSALTISSVLLCALQATAATVAVVPLGGAVGNATEADVLTGKTFSSRAGKGLMGVLELNPSSSGDAVAADVREGKTFSNANTVGITGTIVTQELSPESQTVSVGYYQATTLSTVDTDLTANNIKSGVTIFGIDGDYEGSLASGDAVAADVLAGKTFSNTNAVDIVGTILTRELSSENQTVAVGYYQETTLYAVDTDLVADNIKSGVTIFGINGNYNGEPPVSAPVAQTGQTTSYALGDDGATQAGVAWPVPRFTDHGDGTVTDTLTGLMWETSAAPSGDVAVWAESINLCHVATTGDYPDWRLPNVNELSSLLSRETSSPALPSSHPFTDTGIATFWTSTTLADDDTQAWFVALKDGNTHWAKKTTVTLSVWCVRN